MAGSLGTVARVKILASGTVTRFNVSPFLPGSDLIVRPCGSFHMYSVPVVATGDNTRYWAIQPDGSTVTFTVPTALQATLNAFPSTADASITDANRLQTVVLVNGSPIVRRGQDISSPSAGQFSTQTSTSITFGSTYAAGVAGHIPTIEVLSFAAADIVDSGALTVATGPIEVSQSVNTTLVAGPGCPGYATASGAISVEPLSHH